MADVKKGSDLITTMGATEKRLKKVERQLAVPRKGSSSIVTEESVLTGVFSSTGDSVTVVATANCLVHLFFTLQAKVSTATAATGYIADTTFQSILYNFEVDDTSFLTYASSPATRYEIASPLNDSTDWRTTNLGNIYGGVLTKPYAVAGPITFELQFSVAAASTLTIKNRKLFAWVQPF
jgi:hypothetical protein